MQHQEGIQQKISSVKAFSKPKLHVLMIRAKTVP